MLIRRLILENFRNLQSLDVNLDQGFVILEGGNGAGKTNFLEGIYFGSSLRLFPESRFGQLLKLGEVFSRIQIQSYDKEERRQEIYCENQSGKFGYRLKIDGGEVSRSKYGGLTPVVSFLPQDLILLTRSPGGRRRFLNETLGNIFADYRAALSHYGKILRHRNELWQRIRIDPRGLAELQIWDEQLAEYGSLITDRREKFAEFLNNHFAEVLAPISPELAAGQLHYRKSGESGKADFLKKLSAVQGKEQELGSTIVGPHRDDFWLELNGRPIVGFVSRGQMRGFVLALKILQRDYTQEGLQKSPLLLLDDVFSEFDRSHQQKLAGFLKSFEQVFLTTAHFEEIRNYLPAGVQIFKLRAGQLISSHV